MNEEQKGAGGELLAKLAATVQARSALGESAHGLAARRAAPPTLALGVARRARNRFVLVVRVQQRALQHSPAVEDLAKLAKGEVDVRYIGRVEKRAGLWERQRRRPLCIGCSVGHFNVTAGTLGAFVRPRGGGPLAMLSNNHVLANENRGKKGDDILQPGAIDDGDNPADAVATLADFVRFKRVGANLVDAAMAAVKEGVKADLTKLKGMGKLKGVGDVFVEEGTAVVKIGRTTGRTGGRVTAFEIDNVTVRFDTGLLRFDNQIEIEGEGDGPFSDGGDSGSLIVGRDLRAWRCCSRAVIRAAPTARASPTPIPSNRCWMR